MTVRRRIAVDQHYHVHARCPRQQFTAAEFTHPTLQLVATDGPLGNLGRDHHAETSRATARSARRHEQHRPATSGLLLAMEDPPVVTPGMQTPIRTEALVGIRSRTFSARHRANRADRARCWPVAVHP